jgi:hypothetical protein
VFEPRRGDIIALAGSEKSKKIPAAGRPHI